MSGAKGLQTALIDQRYRPLMEKRGAVAHVMAQSKQYRGYPFVSLTAWIDPPIFVDQIAIFYDSKGRNPVGYITWAWLAPDVVDRWKNDPKVMLHESEWTEGESLWIMDFVALPGYCLDIIALVKKTMFLEVAEANWLRRDVEGRIRKCNVYRRVFSKS
jgi:cytolysin-activating lysine-acyltransferase